MVLGEVQEPSFAIGISRINHGGGLYLHFIAIYLKCGQIHIDVNSIKKNAAEYWMVKYDDDVIDIFKWAVEM